MRKLVVFNNVSLDGYIADKNGDMNWAHDVDPEWRAFTSSNAKGDATLVFGRTTYDLMIQFWPTPAAMEHAPDVAKSMNAMPKIVFSRTLKNPTWNNTTVIDGDIVERMRQLKEQTDRDMVILGSASIVAQFATAGLIDEYQIAVTPRVLGGGTSMFTGVNGVGGLKLAETRPFKNGKVFLRYEAAG